MTWAPETAVDRDGGQAGSCPHVIRADGGDEAVSAREDRRVSTSGNMQSSGALKFTRHELYILVLVCDELISLGYL